jgi:hypothetical protein
MLNQLIEIISVGLPFCIFKVVTGIYLNQYWLILLGGIDLLINVANILSVLISKERVTESCFFAWIILKVGKINPTVKDKWHDLGNSIDVLLSFTLVAYMIGSGAIVDVPGRQLTLWNVSVVFNVFGAGYSRLHGSIKNLRT